MSYTIVPVKGHYEIYINGAFYCAVDNIREAEDELKNYYGGTRNG